jgi:hypothetical protein
MKLVMSFFVFAVFQNVQAASMDCESLNNTAYQDEYKVCKEAEKTLQKNQSSDCEGLNNKAYQDEYKVCKKMEAAAKKDQKQDTQPVVSQNSWVQALGSMAMPLSEVALNYIKETKIKHENNDAWDKAYAEAYNAPENKANRDEFERALEERAKNGTYPLTLSEVSRYTTLVTDYNLLRKTFGSKDLPSYEEFKKNPELYITKTGLEVFVHKKGKNLKKEKKTACEEVNEKYVICNGNKYIRSTEETESLKRFGKQVEEKLEPMNKNDSAGVKEE